MGLSAVADEKRTIRGIRIRPDGNPFEEERAVSSGFVFCSTSARVYSEKIDCGFIPLTFSAKFHLRVFPTTNFFFFPFPFFFLSSFSLFLSLYLLTFANSLPSPLLLPKFPRDSEYFLATSVTGSWCFHAS